MRSAKAEKEHPFCKLFVDCVLNALNKFIILLHVKNKGNLTQK